MISLRLAPVRSALTALAIVGIAMSASQIAACGGNGESDGGAGSVSGSTTSSPDGPASDSASSTATGGEGTLPTGGPIFIVMMENKNWADIKAGTSAPYIMSLTTQFAYAEQYYNPQYQHPSLGNYIWLESGDNLGMSRDATPAESRSDTTEHLVTMLEDAGLTWKSYQEDVDGTECPLKGKDAYVPRHNPMVYFDDVTNDNDAAAARCISHVRPYAELATDLAAGTVADYNFLTPNLCNDMHNVCPPQSDSVKQGDDWLSVEIPKLLASDAYANGATIFIAFDEGLLSDGPLMFIALSKKAKVGYASQVHFTHSSTLKTVQEMLGVMPLLRHAGDADTNDLRDLFNP